MSDPSGALWSDNPNAPHISSLLYTGEKQYFAGQLIGIISYGIVVALFFQCMWALLSPTNPISRSIRWALVVHTVALFLFLTIPLGVDLDYLSIEYINNREFTGNTAFQPGPLGYDDVLHTEETGTLFNVMFPLNQWLADGLLLHRCYVIYSTNHWVMAFPCLMYLASVVLGVASIYYDSGSRFFTFTSVDFSTSYVSICLSLNVLLTLMIVIRLLVHIRNLRKATGAPGGRSGLHTTAAAVVVMLIESYALYATTLVAYIIPWALQSSSVNVFSEIIGTVQVITPYLIILRVAKRRALTNKSISEITESIHFRSQGSMDGDGSFPHWDPTNTVEVNMEASGEPVAGDENAVEVPL